MTEVIEEFCSFWLDEGMARRVYVDGKVKHVFLYSKPFDFSTEKKVDPSGCKSNWSADGRTLYVFRPANNSLLLHSADEPLGKRIQPHRVDRVARELDP